jgi:glutamate/tyrosine decarboxylase-like PLP-dependent enzyme
MEDLIQRITELENISKELDPPELKRNEYLRQIQNYANCFLNGLEVSKAYSDKKADVDALAINGRKKTLDELLKIYENEVAGKGINAASGRHLGYVPGGGVFTSALADFMADVTNEYAGLYYASPGAAVIENEILNWMKSIFGFPVNAVGSITSGGSIANLIALTAARDHHRIKSDNILKSVIYLSPQTHHSINKALKIIGLEDIIIRYSNLDMYFRIDTEKLEEQIRKDQSNGLNPFLVIATAGTTDTGAVDPLSEIGDIARKNNLWYHIDAAYGGFFILTSQKKDLLKGIEMADSLVTDPHKGLFIPSGSGAVLVKNRKAVLHSHNYSANYMQDATCISTEIYEPENLSPELTRHFRALRIWLPLQLHGIEPFVACLEEKLLLTLYFRNRLSEIGFKTGPVPDLSISYFWYPSKTIDENVFNQKLLKLIHKEGNIFFSSTKINQKFVIRIAVLSFRTDLKIIDKAIETLNNARLQLEKNED